VLATLVAVAASPAAAEAAVRAAGPVSGPVLAGDLVVWADARDDGGFDVRTAPTSGGEPRTLFSSQQGSDAVYFEPRVAASAEGVIVEAIEHERGGRNPSRYVAQRVFAGPTTGPLEEIGARCPGASPHSRTVDVSGDSFAFRNCDAQIEIRRFGSPDASRRISGGGYGFRVSSRFVASLAGFSGGMTVYDRHTGEVAYRLEVGQTGGAAQDFDLGDDGVLAMDAYVGASRTRLWVASPNAPQPRPLQVPADRGSYHPRIVGDQIAFARYRDPREPGPGGEIGVVGLEGEERLLVRGAAVQPYEPTLDFDGTRIAYFTYNCADATIHVSELGAPLREFGQRQGCPLALEKPPKVSSSLRKVVLHLDCFGFSGAFCSSPRIDLTRRGVLMGRGTPVGNRSRVVLTARARAALVRAGRLKVRASGIVLDDRGRRERRTSTLTLKRP
jgi:hypothetical protein